MTEDSNDTGNHNDKSNNSKNAKDMNNYPNGYPALPPVGGDPKDHPADYGIFDGRRPDYPPSIKSRYFAERDLALLRGYLIAGASAEQICNIMKISRKVYEKYTKAIGRQDKRILEKHAKKTVYLEMGILKDRLNDTVRNCTAMANDDKNSVFERLEAEHIKIEASTMIMQMVLEGPRVVNKSFNELTGELIFQKLGNEQLQSIKQLAEKRKTEVIEMFKVKEEKVQEKPKDDNNSNAPAEQQKQQSEEETGSEQPKQD